MAEKKFNVPSNILYYSFDLVGWGSADIARFIMGDFIPHFPQSTSQGSNTQLAWTGEKLLKKWPQNTIIFLVPMNIPELAPSDFFSNFVWPPEGAAIVFLKIGILSWKFFWTFILWQKLVLWVCESIFCPKMSQNGQKITLAIFFVLHQKS